ncbi:MAG: hypothetical protein AAAB23_27105 [Pseudomonas sp.]
MSLVTLVSRSLEMGDFGEWTQGGMPGDSPLRVGEVRVFMMATLSALPKGWDLLIFTSLIAPEDQKIAAFGSSYRRGDF